MQNRTNNSCLQVYRAHHVCVPMRLEILNKTRVAADITELPAENLSPIDASPLLLKTVNCPSLKFNYHLDFATLHQAAVDLLQEYPILAGRIIKASKHELSKHPYLKAAPYCIHISAADAGIMLYEAAADVAADNLMLNQALTEPFGITPGSVVLPSWYQPLNVAAMFQGKESLLKLQLTHCTDGGSILAATLPHLLADSHSSTLLLTRLSELYRQQRDTLSTTSTNLPTPTQTNAAAAAASTTDEFLEVAPRSSSSYTGTNTSMTGVAFKALRASALGLPKPTAEAAAVGTTAAAVASTARTAEAPAVGSGGEESSAALGRAASAADSLSGSQTGGLPGVAFERVTLNRVSSGKTLTAAPAGSGATAAAAAAASPASSTAAAAAAAAPSSAAAAVAEYEGLSLAQHAAKQGVTNTSKPWSKALLLPQGRKDVATPTALKALSLDLQSVDKPSLGSTLGWLAAAFKEGLAANRAFPGAASSLTSTLLSIPQADVAQIKALASASSMGSPSNPVSTNDAISALVWLTFCDLRGRPLPGSSSSNGGKKPCKPFSMFSCSVHSMPNQANSTAVAAVDGGALGLAVDLRQNCADLKQIPGNYFGNAAWCLHIVGSGTASQAHTDISSSNSKSKSGNGDVAAAAAAVGSSMQAGGLKCGVSYAPALQSAANAVRRALTSFRQSKRVGNTLLQLIEAQQAAPTSILVRNLSRLAVKVDAFITSWQFPAHQVDFGGGAPAEYCCVVRPTPPWQAAVLPSRPAGGGAQLLLTVPASAAAALKASPVLKQLVPNASFQQ